nr:receptor-type tyrosine-protein phosphatase F-like [Leptinotarsa decemlineata]
MDSIKIIILFGLTLLRLAKSQEEIFMVGNKWCITNSSSALAIIKDIEDTDEGRNNLVSSFYPTSETLATFENSNQWTKYWTVDNWNVIQAIHGPIKQYVTDRRWEVFPVFKSTGAKDYKEVLTISNSRNFNIPLSVRTKADKHVHIFLCDGDTVYYNCYRISLDFQRGLDSVIYKCGSTKWYSSTQSCELSYVNKVNINKPLSEDEWTHFRIERKQNMIKVYRGNDVFMTYYDSSRSIFDTKSIHISSDGESLWKFHDYNYLLSQYTDGYSHPIGSSIKIEKNKTCISMFVSMCQSCRLRITINDEETNGNSIKIIEDISSEDEKWSEKKIIIDTQNYIGQHLNILQYKHRDGYNLRNNPFWALDDVRLCEEEEYRYVKSDRENILCEKIGEQTNDIVKINEVTEKQSRLIDFHCPENTFGKFCLPCDIFGQKYCSKFVYCDMNKSKQDCHCTSGYRGKNCQESCDSGKYGHGCSKLCSEHCINSCSRLNGYCNKGECEEPYVGPMCDKSSQFFFLNPPVVEDITPTSGVVRVKDFTIVGPTDENKPTLYDIEYAIDPNQNKDKTIENKVVQEWFKKKNGINFYTENEVRIDDLKPDSFYLVRAVVVQKNEKRGNYIKSTRFHTTCNDLREQDIIIEATNVSATIDIKWPTNGCRPTRYEVHFDGNKRSENWKKRVYFPGLEPFSNYNFKMKHRMSGNVIEKNFTTKEGVPFKVELVSAQSYMDRITLSWKEPTMKRGNIIRYDIKYTYLRSRGTSCPPALKIYNESTAETSFTIYNLKAYSQYQIVIYAVTRAGAGDEFVKNMETDELDYITDNEKLAIESHNEFSNSVTIELTKISCEDLRGNIYIQQNATCSHEWCTEKKSNLNIFFVTSPFITLDGLSAYSNYTVEMSMSRNRTSWIDIGKVDFQTKPSVPNSISQLEAISKDESSISLRWKEPYPPTGVLKRYLIEYAYYSYEYNYQESVSLKPCPLWKDYHCGNVTKNLHWKYTYTIRVLARNEIPENFNNISEEVNVYLGPEKSQPTYGVTVFFSNKTNDMNISWYHPNVTNGPLRSFEITLRNEQNGIQHPELELFRVTEANYSITYSTTVSAAHLSTCTKYRVSIRVHNIYKKSNWNGSIATTPPDIPPDIPTKNLTYESTNTSITIHVPNIGNGETIYEKKLYVVVSKATETDELPLFEKNIFEKTNPEVSLKASWLAYDGERRNSSLVIMIGSQNQSESELSRNNQPLEPGTNYSVTFFLSNECFDLMRLSRSQIFIKTQEAVTETDENTSESPETNGGNGGLWALILLLVPIVLIGYWYNKNKKPKRTDLLIPENIRNENVPLSKLTNPGGNMIAVKPKKSLPQLLPPLNTTHSLPVRINDLEKYVREAIQSGELKRQHDLFPRGLVKPCEYGSMPENKTKNRYKNLIAYDDTRVKLRKIRGDEFSDYINASYVDGYKKPRCYIATQGPKNNTLADFWRMIWQEKVKNIVMLANVYENGKKKVEKYWPDINEDLKFGIIRVQHVSTDTFANFDIRIFSIHCNNEERKIEQLHYTTWPDHGVPLYSQSLVPFLRRVLKIPYNPQSPIVVHCSAGVGRTGTIILSDICLRMAAGEGCIDFLAHLENIRNQRANLVDNVEQYKLAHLVVVECLFAMHTAVPCNEDMPNTVDEILKSGGIETQMKYIIETQWQDFAMETMLEHEQTFPIYPEKNRFENIIPRHYRVFLTCYPVDDASSSYINAVLVDGFRNPGRYISTQQPMPNTLGDFWRLVVERSCGTIISLNSLDFKDQTVCKFYPNKNEELNPLDIITVQHVKTKGLEYYKVITVQVHSNMTNPFNVDIIEINNWASNALCPNSIEEFLSFIDAAEAISRKSERVIVTCYDGATASGLYLAMTFLIEKMKLEQDCDVCLAVRTIRHSRQEFVTTEEQYKFLYEASVTFITGFQSYSNFT